MDAVCNGRDMVTQGNSGQRCRSVRHPWLAGQDRLLNKELFLHSACCQPNAPYVSSRATNYSSLTHFMNTS